MLISETKAKGPVGYGQWLVLGELDPFPQK